MEICEGNYPLVLLFLCLFIANYRLGTIYKTGFYWINDTDLEILETSSIYLYGFVPLESDSVYNGSPADTFFQFTMALDVVLRSFRSPSIYEESLPEKALGRKNLLCFLFWQAFYTPKKWVAHKSKCRLISSRLSVVIDVINKDRHSSKGIARDN
jgi:hypothetical protein